MSRVQLKNQREDRSDRTLGPGSGHLWLARGAALETFAMRVLHALLPTTSGPSRSYSADSIILDLLAMACPLHSGPMSRVTQGGRARLATLAPDLSVDQPVEHLD